MFWFLHMADHYIITTLCWRLQIIICAILSSDQDATRISILLGELPLGEFAKRELYDFSKRFIAEASFHLFRAAVEPATFDKTFVACGPEMRSRTFQVFFPWCGEQSGKKMAH